MESKEEKEKRYIFTEYWDTKIAKIVDNRPFEPLVNVGDKIRIRGKEYKVIDRYIKYTYIVCLNEIKEKE